MRKNRKELEEKLINKLQRFQLWFFNHVVSVPKEGVFDLGEGQIIFEQAADRVCKLNQKDLEIYLKVFSLIEKAFDERDKELIKNKINIGIKF